MGSVTEYLNARTRGRHVQAEVAPSGLRRAMQVLRLRESPRSNGELKEAFTAAARRAHPDSPDHDPDGPSMDDIITARKTLEENIALNLPNRGKVYVNTCKMCAGRGMVPGSFGAQQCVACNGTGEQQ